MTEKPTLYELKQRLEYLDPKDIPNIVRTEKVNSIYDFKKSLTVTKEYTFIGFKCVKLDNYQIIITGFSCVSLAGKLQHEQCGVQLHEVMHRDASTTVLIY